MNRLRLVLLALMLLAALLTACAKIEKSPTAGEEQPAAPAEPVPEMPTTLNEPAAPEEPEVSAGLVLPENMPVRFGFSSGAGAWSTGLTLQRDGSFAGLYSDANMGESGEGYLATVYTCTFAGRFTEIEKLDENSFCLRLGEISCEKPEGESWVDENQVRYVASAPFGLEEGEEFILYLPQTPVKGLNEAFLSWWPYRGEAEEEKPTQLGFYGLWNVKMGYGFFG